MNGRERIADDDRAVAPAITCVVLLAGVAVLWTVTRHGVPGIDSWLHRVVLERRGATSLRIARAATQGGSTRVVWPLLALATLIHPRGRDRRGLLAALAFTAAVGAGIGVRLALSLLAARPRPATVDWASTAGGYAFPSGHTTAATRGAGALAWAVARHSGRRGVRFLAWGAAATYAAAVGWSRVWLGVHWPADVAGGWLLGAGWLAGMAWAIRRIRAGLARRARRTGTPGTRYGTDGTLRTTRTLPTDGAQRDDQDRIGATRSAGPDDILNDRGHPTRERRQA